MDLTELPTPNIPLLRKAVEWAEAEAVKPRDKRQWDQSFYVSEAPCGTAYCIAGWAVVNAHPQQVTTELGCLYIDDEPAEWHNTARDLLGLTESEASDLFDDANDIEDVRARAEDIAARAGERL